MAEPDESESCYEILGVDPGASSSEILAQAYRKLALAKHPDRGGDPEEFARLSKAYEARGHRWTVWAEFFLGAKPCLEVLSNAKSRANYDKTGRTSKLTAEEEFIEDPQQQSMWRIYCSTHALSYEARFLLLQHYSQSRFVSS